MNKYILVLILVTPLQVLACMGKTMPNLSKIDSYTSIFTGEVTGIQVTEYQKNRIEAINEGKKFNNWFSDITLEHELTIIVNKFITGSGSAPQVIKIKAKGCAVQLPQMKMQGVFFIKPDGYAIPIYALEGQRYSETLLKLGKYTRLTRRSSGTNNP